jgi:phosphatidate cytidylyltransferase
MTAPDPLQQTIVLFAGIGVVLLIASAIGFVLKASIARGQPHGGIDNLNARIKAWWVMVLVIGVAFLFGDAGVTLLFVFISFVTLHEFMSVTCAQPRPPALAAGYFIVLPLQYADLPRPVWRLPIFVPMYSFLVLPIVIAAARDTRGFRARREDAMGSRDLRVLHFACAGAADARDSGVRRPGPPADRVRPRRAIQRRAAVCLGQALRPPQGGARRFALETWEGLVGGVASATTLGAALYWITPFAAWQAALMALAITSMGFFGGLVMSAIKRAYGAKDWGRMIEGHGGMLDRLDSVVFAAPVFFYLTRYGWT